MTKSSSKRRVLTIKPDESVVISQKIRTVVLEAVMPSATQVSKVGKLAGKRASLLAQRALREAG